MPSLVRPTSITYGSAFENPDYRAAYGRTVTNESVNTRQTLTPRL